MAEKKDKINLQRNGENIRIHIPLKFKKRGGRKEIITPEDYQATDMGRSKTQRPLVVALARTSRWPELLETGKIASIAALAKRLRVDRAYVSRILDLTLLAPDIIDAILDGREPSGLSLARLTKKQIPLLWEEQRENYGLGNKEFS
ncbi:MAG: hypothetical protein P9L99_16815 [Candidatus Lernaella stagnicola]|nr:hypothetical protein [Candidatus Lernaella stagnicola]